MRFLQKRYYDELKNVAVIAKSYYDNNKCLSWGQCIRLAEKVIRAKK